MSMKKGPLSQLLSNLICLYVDKDIVEKISDPLKLTGNLIKKFQGTLICSAFIGLKNARNVVEHNIQVTSGQRNMTRTTLINILLWLSADAFRCNDLGYVADKEIRDECIIICKTGIAEITKASMKLKSEVSEEKLEKELRTMLLDVTPTPSIASISDDTTPKGCVSNSIESSTTQPVLPSVKRKMDQSFEEELPFKKRKLVHIVDTHVLTNTHASHVSTNTKDDEIPINILKPGDAMVSFENFGKIVPAPILDNNNLISENNINLVDQIQSKVNTLFELVDSIKAKVEKDNSGDSKPQVKESVKKYKQPSANRDARFKIPIKSCKTFVELRGTEYNSLKGKRVFITNGPHRGCEYRFVTCNDGFCTLNTLSGKSSRVSPHTRFVLA